MSAVVMGLGLAAAPAMAGAIVTDCRPHDPAQEAADAALVETAVPLMQARDLTALAVLRPQIEAALGHAPDVATLAEHCGNTIVVRSGDTMAFLAQRERISGDPRFKGASIQLRAAMPYASLGFISGWIAYEQGDFDAAAKAYQKGLLNDPASVELASEYSSALVRQGRMNDTVAFIDGFLTANPGLDPLAAARLQRRRGYALTEMQRFDDALAAYDVSLRLDPANAAATAEIADINRKKALQN